jgi:tRNA(Ile)-lysidine synthase
VDSVALLEILVRLRATLGFHLSALHVNHQISPNATAWAEFCARLCAERDVPYATIAVQVSRHDPKGLEAAAREARYRVFYARHCDFVVLAHHLDDQAETLLLQLLRGAGVKGLSAMPEVRRQGAGEGTEGAPAVLRPLLEVTRQTLRDYVKERGVPWVEDESNVNPSFDRNFLRHHLLPVLERRFPAYRTAFHRACRNFAEAAELLDDLAGIDGAEALLRDRLDLYALRGLSPARVKNVLRYYLVRQGVPLPSAGRLDNLVQQLTTSRDDAQVRVAIGDFELRRHRGEVHVCRRLAGGEAKLRMPWELQPVLDLPYPGGRLCFERTTGRGISLSRLMGGGEVLVRYRQGGERFRPDCRRPTRTLKNLLQETGIPPWQRQRLPLLFSGERLVFVPGIGIDCDYQAGPDEEGVAVSWENEAIGSG